VKVKQEVWKMASLAEKVYMDLMARGKDIETARCWRRWTMKFEVCCGIKSEYDRDDVIRYLSCLREQGYRQSSIDVMVRPLKLLAQIQGWNFPRLAMPKVRDGDIRRPILSYEEVCLMIRRGKEVLSARELAYLALSSTYGLRREELCGLGRIDGKVTVETVKGGPVTIHLVPDEIRPYLAGYERTGVRYMSFVFRRIVEKLGISLAGGKYGWHAIRRALATELLYRDVSLINVVRFMRWSDGSVKGEFGMLAIYGKRNQEEVDRSVFKVHPFLPIWSDGGE
jgi:integrase